MKVLFTPISIVAPESIPIANRIQAWTVGARWALEHEWDGRALSAGGVGPPMSTVLRSSEA